MAYELWDAESANLLDAYETEADALAAVQALLSEHGTGYIETLVLGYEDRRGRSRTIALGWALVERARAHALDVAAARLSSATPAKAASSLR